VAQARAAGRAAFGPAGAWTTPRSRSTAGAAALDGDLSMPPADKVANATAVRPAIDELVVQLKSYSVALEYTGKPPSGALAAQISAFDFGTPVFDDQGEVVDYEPAESFPAGTNEVAVLFDYENMQDGQEVVFKVLIDGEEDPSWRLVAPWDLGASGSAFKPLSLAYSDSFVLASGFYEVELYIDGHLAQRGFFVVEP
jgi:hypothetical protein